MNKLVSIILPTYNGEEFLKIAIDSCLKQSYKNIELIIVNDCSTDTSELIVKSYNDNRITYIKNDINQKLPRSLNIGFSHAKGDYYTWTSDDNYYDTEAIQKMVTELELNNADIVYAPYHTIDGVGEVTGFRSVGARKDILLDNVVKACFLYKKKVQLKLKGYNPNLFLVEDYDFWIRAAYLDFKFLPLDDELYFYRFHENSLTEKRRIEISRALYFLLIDYEVKFKESNRNQYLKGEFYLKLVKLGQLNKESVLDYYKKAIMKNPLLIFSKTTLKFLFT